MNALGVEQRIASFVEKYEPRIALQVQEARGKFRTQFPRGFELVFDNYNALVFGISPTQRTSDSFMSIAAYPRWLTLFFLRGVDLRDPLGILEGSGSQVRSIRLKSPTDLESSMCREFMTQAVEPHRSALLASPPLTTVIKMVAEKQRPRRPEPRKHEARARKNVA